MGSADLRPSPGWGKLEVGNDRGHSDWTLRWANGLRLFRILLPAPMGLVVARVLGLGQVSIIDARTVVIEYTVTPRLLGREETKPYFLAYNRNILLKPEEETDTLISKA